MIHYEFCQCHEDVCPCGKFGTEILKCKKPFSDARMQEIFDAMRQKVSDERMQEDSPYAPH